MSAPPLWLATGDACDPSRVPAAARAAMAVARRIEIAPGASPALALWGLPECVARVDDAGARDPAATTIGLVRLAPAPPPAGGGVWEAVALEPAPTPLDASLRDATVVLTRPWPDIRMNAPTYAARGACVVPWPLSALVAPPDPGALRRAAQGVAEGRYAAVGVTSARAAQAWCEVAPRDAGKGERPFLVAIGDATAAALVTGGLAPDLVTEGGGEAMGEALGEHARGRTVLLVAAAGGRTEAEDGARARGAAVEVVAAYGMDVPAWRDVFDSWTADALKPAHGRATYVTWFSPRGVERGMKALGPALLEAAWVTVGEVTARAARALGSPKGGIEVAEAPSAAAVRDAVVRLHRERRRRRA